MSARENEYRRREIVALERIADALEGVIEIMTEPMKITSSEPASSKPQMITTPAPQFVEPKDDLPDDSVEPLGDEDDDS